ncbi:hypothetical protein [Agrococcus jejuensis]|uniref:hypothetical protein n=1 Tax=Agrococcus jejuensis TaxID=399736 RepID=UPI0011A306FD|nr:hypothetical protein [Agrococcus jejuensis]
MATVTRVAPAPMGPALAIVVGVAALTRGALIVVGLWLFVGVFIMVGVEEILGTLPGAVDVAARATVVGLGVLVLVGGVGETARVVVERALRLRTARRLAAAGAPMPPAVERAQLVRGAVGPLRVLVGVLGGSSLLVAPFLLGFADGDANLVIAGIATLVAGLLLLLLAIVALAPVSRWWRAELERLERAWPRFRRTDEPIGARMTRERRVHVAKAKAGDPSARPRRRSAVQRLDAALASGTVVAFLIVVLGVFLRQQCRRCEPVRYDPWGESLVDGVATIGLVLFVGAIVLLVLRGIASIVAQAVREVLAARAAQAGTLRRSAWLDRAVVSATSVEVVALVVGVLGMAATGLVVASGVDADVMGEPEDRFVVVRGWASLEPLAGALLAAAFVLGVVGALTTRAWRSVVWTDLRGDPWRGRLDGGEGSGSHGDAGVGMGVGHDGDRHGSDGGGDGGGGDS